MASLTITDNADGTGATATVAASSGANTVYTGRVAGSVGTVAFTLSGSRTGDGAVPLSLSKGMYFAYVLNSGGLSNFVYFAVTDQGAAGDAVGTRCRRAVVDTLALLGIPPVGKIYEQIVPDESNVKYPCTIVTTDGLQETEQQVMNNRDDVGHPVKVMFCDRHDKLDPEKLPTYERWRELGQRCFRSGGLAGVPEILICSIENYVIVDPNVRIFQRMVSGFTVRARCREPRGIGV